MLKLKKSTVFALKEFIQLFSGNATGLPEAGNARRGCQKLRADCQRQSRTFLLRNGRIKAGIDPTLNSFTHISSRLTVRTEGL